MHPVGRAAAARSGRGRTLRAGAVIGGVYRVHRLIGRGGEGAVYEVTHLEHGSRLAAKVLDRSAGEKTTEGLLREAQAATAIDHDNVVAVTDVGCTEGGLPFVVMELLRGGDLRALQPSPGAAGLDDGAVRDIVAQLLLGLSAIHRAGVIHRDVKPENVFLAERGTRTVVKLVDLGIHEPDGAPGVRLTPAGKILGTPLYMSPEQCRGVPALDARSDIYSAGVMIYELLAGTLPFAAGTLYECAYKHMEVAPSPLGERRPDLPPGVVAAVHRALAKDPAERFASATDFLHAWTAAWETHQDDDAPPRSGNGSEPFALM